MNEKLPIVKLEAHLLPRNCGNIWLAEESTYYVPRYGRYSAKTLMAMVGVGVTKKQEELINDIGILI